MGNNRMAGRGVSITGGNLRTSMRSVTQAAPKMPSVMSQIATGYPLHFGINRGNMSVPTNINFGGMVSRSRSLLGRRWKY